MRNLLSERTGIIIIIIGSIILIVSTILFLIFGSWQFSNILNEGIVGQFGDFIGGIVGSLFTLVGVILFYVALTDQRVDFRTNQNALSLQIEALNQQIIEFKAQRKELESTRKIYEQQTKTMKNQQFDSNFYSLLNGFITLKKNLNDSCISGDFFEDKFQLLAENIKYDKNINLINFHNKIIEEYESIYLEDRAKLFIYFKNVYRLLKMIDACDHLNLEEKIFYSRVLRDQITNTELLVLHYNYHSVYGKPVQHLVLKYDFLKHIEILSKITFVKQFIIDSKEKHKLTIFTDQLKNLLENNLKVAESIENVEAIKVEEKIETIICIIGIYIDLQVDINITMDNSQMESMPVPKEQFKEIIYLFLNEVLFYNKFALPLKNNITKSITTSEQYTTFNFSILNI